jgi:threonine/homoserine/homoserine lactone efflux protein
VKLSTFLHFLPLFLNFTTQQMMMMMMMMMVVVVVVVVIMFCEITSGMHNVVTLETL